MEKTYRVKIRRATKINGRLVRTGDVVDVDTITFNTLLHFGKAHDMGPVADERETELKARMARRGRLPKPAPLVFEEEETPPGDDD